jgi:acetolactate synthase-1/2/3 large subunit
MYRTQNVADVLCESLHEQGVRTLFGVPGTQSVVLYESLRRSRLRTITACSELNAVFMANGYYRASGEPGVVITIGGPGFTFGLAGLAEARHDSVALLHIVCSSDKKPGKSFQLQDVDVAVISGSVAKSFHRITSPDAVQAVITDAYQETRNGEPSPVVVEIPASVLGQPASPAHSPKSPASRPISAVSDDMVRSLSTRLLASRRPLLLIGHGCAGNAHDTVLLAEMLNAAVVTNCSGRGIIPDDHHLAICSDFTGWGVDLVNELIDSSDCILVLGCKLSHNGTSGFRLRLPPERTIQVDASPQVLGANYAIDLGLVADVPELLPALIQRLKEEKSGSPGWAADEIAAWQSRFHAKRLDSVPKVVEPRISSLKDINAFFDTLQQALPATAAVVTDSGLHQVLTRRLLQIKSPRGLIVPADFQSMGYGIPAAIGAACSVDDRCVVAIIGDGGFAMSGLELSTAVREQIDLLVIVFSDGFLGQIRFEQLKEYGIEFGTRLGTFSVRGIAESVGASFIELKEDATASLRTALDLKGVRVIEVPLKDVPQLKAVATKQLAREFIKQMPGTHSARKLLKKIRKSLQ